MEIDRKGQQILTKAECLQLLGTVRSGRIALSKRALPTIMPVMYRIDGATVTFGVSGGLLAAAAERGDVVCFEADFTSADESELWSVVVVGKLRLIPGGHAAAEDASAKCRGRVASLPMTIVSGRATMSVSV